MKTKDEGLQDRSRVGPGQGSWWAERLAGVGSWMGECAAGVGRWGGRTDVRGAMRGAMRGSVRGSVRVGMRKGLGLLAVMSVVLSLVTVALWPATTNATNVNVLANGGFEGGFTSQSGCGIGMVGAGWQCFTNGGAANYGFYDDQWERTVAEGKHSQLIEVNTKGIMLGDPDRYAGIYQTVRVVDWAEYTLSLSGLIRTTNMEGDPWRYRVQVGWSAGPAANWQNVTNWTDVGWDKYYPRTEPGSFASYSTKLMAEADTITVYVRVWKKWGVGYEELDVNLDAISLTGPSPYTPEPWPQPWPPQDGWTGGQAGCAEPCGGTGGPVQPIQPLPVQPVQPLPQPLPQPVGPGCVDPCAPVQPLPVGVCAGPNLVYNGSFELGFNPVSVGHVGKSWGFFTNDGAANYGFYDDQWTPVVADGAHAQLIEINTKGVYPADNDRYAGIYQYITGLHPGVTYEFRMKGLLRGAGNEDDPYRFAAQVGYLPGYNASWQQVTNWNEMNLGPIYKRTEPGPLGEYTLRFVAPAQDLTLFIRGWKKWGITNVEMDFNIDAVSLRGCLLYGTGGAVDPVVYERPLDGSYGQGGPDGPVGGWGDCGGGCSSDGGYTLPPLAVDPVNPVWPPVSGGCGQDCGGAQGDWSGGDWSGGGSWSGGGAGVCSYTVQAGDTLAWAAQSMGVSQGELIAANGIMNPDLIFVGQVLANPSCGGGQAGWAKGGYDGGAGAGYGAGDYGAAAPAGDNYGAGYGAGDYGAAPAGQGMDFADYPAVDPSGAPAGAMEGGAGDYGATPAGDNNYGAAGYGAGSYPAGDYPAGGYPAGDYPAGDYPAGDAPAGYPDAQAGWDAPAAAAPMGGQTYTVQAGDNLSQIAAGYGVSVDQLMAVNGIYNPNIIYVGQQLIIP